MQALARVTRANVVCNRLFSIFHESAGQKFLPTLCWGSSRVSPLLSTALQNGSTAVQKTGFIPSSSTVVCRCVQTTADLEQPQEVQQSSEDRCKQNAEYDAETMGGSMQAARIYIAGDTADALCDALLGCGAASCSIEAANLGKDGEQEIYTGPEPWGSPADVRLWVQSAVTALFPNDVSIEEALDEAATILGLPKRPEFHVSMTKDQDWVETIKDSYQPVEICRGLWVIPSWCEPVDPGAINVLLEPGMAFGTGDHPTTRLCMAWVKSVVKDGDRVMDYGIGSGILSIMAIKLGAAAAVGVDIDPLSISASRYNAERNGLNAETLRVYLADRESPENPLPEDFAIDPLDSSPDGEGQGRGVGAFDIVVANILINPLVALASRIVSYAKPRGLVGLSGVLEEQVPQVVRTYAELLNEIEVTTEGGWACVAGRKR